MENVAHNNLSFDGKVNGVYYLEEVFHHWLVC